MPKLPPLNQLCETLSTPQPAQECKPLCELCVKRGYNFCANVAQTTPITVQSAQPVVNQQMTTVKESLTPQSAQPVAQPNIQNQIVKDILEKP